MSSFWEYIEFFFSNNSTKLTSDKNLTNSVDSSDLVFKYLLSLIKKPLDIQDLTNQYQKVLQLNPTERVKNLISLYFNFEKFIVEAKLPVVDRTYTKGELRLYISKSLDLKKLDPHFRLIFLVQSEQVVLLFELGLFYILDYAIKTLGKRQVQDLIKKTTAKTFLEGSFLVDSHFNHPQILETVLPRLTKAEIIQTYAGLFNSLWIELENFLGTKQAITPFRKAYEFMRQSYEYEIVSIFLDVLPKKAFAEVRFGFLSRQELEKEVIDRTEEIKRGQLELKKERDRARAIVSSMGDGLLVLDKDFTIVIINPTAEKLLGVSSSEAIGKYWYDFIKVYKGQTELTSDQRSPLKSLAGGKPVITTINDDHYYQTPSGQRFPVASVTSPLIDEKGNITGVIKVFRDITHEKEEKNIIEQTVKERTRELSEEKARLVGSIEAIVRAYAMIDIHGEVILTNRKLASFLGDPDGAWTLEKIQVKLSGVFDIISAYKKVIEERKTIEVKEILLGTKYFDIHVSPVFLQEKELIGVLILLGDITEQKILDRSKDEFFSIASHELRTPLTAIRGNTALILDYYKDKLTDQTLKEMIDDIHDSSIRLIQIVNDFLNVSRLEQGRIQLVREEFDFVELSNSVFKELEINASEKKLFLKLDKETDLPKVFTDKNRTKEVLINLIGNSIKFTDQGGITVSLNKKDHHLKVSVIDTGRGISLKNQSLLFHKFQQAQEQILTRDFTRGTGLGLYISKLMIEHMGGRIWLENSEEGKGSTFSFTLPFTTNQVIIEKKPEEKTVANYQSAGV